MGLLEGLVKSARPVLMVAFLAGVWTETPGVRGVVVAEALLRFSGEKRSERSWGAASSGLLIGLLSGRNVRVCVL